MTGRHGNKYWIEELEKSSRGTVGDFQKTLVEAIEDVGDEANLLVSLNDLCWALWVVKLRKRLKRKKKAG